MKVLALHGACDSATTPKTVASVNAALDFRLEVHRIEDYAPEPPTAPPGLIECRMRGSAPGAARLTYRFFHLRAGSTSMKEILLAAGGAFDLVTRDDRVFDSLELLLQDSSGHSVGVTRVRPMSPRLEIAAPATRARCPASSRRAYASGRSRSTARATSAA